MDPYAQQFWSYTQQQELRLQRCSDCADWRWPAAAVCPSCLSEEYEWARVSGTGALLTWVTFERQYFPEYPPPHTAIMVELDEGPLFISTPVDVAESALADGMRMQLDWVDAADRFGEYFLPVFRPVER